MRINSFLYFYPEKPRLIHIDQPLFEELSNKPEWVAEKKYNEKRLQLHCLDGDFQFWNRHEALLNYTPTPQIISKLPPKGYYLFDGGLRDRKAIGVRDKVLIFDVFVWNGQLQLGKTFRERRALLETMFEIEGDPVGLPFQFHLGFKQIFDNVIKDDEIEGLVLKNVKGTLDLGRTRGQDSKWMIKVRKPSGRYQF